MLAGRGAGRDSDFFWVGMDNERIRKRVREKKGVACNSVFSPLASSRGFFLHVGTTWQPEGNNF